MARFVNFNALISRAAPSNFNIEEQSSSIGLLIADNPAPEDEQACLEILFHAIQIKIDTDKDWIPLTEALLSQFDLLLRGEPRKLGVWRIYLDNSRAAILLAKGNFEGATEAFKEVYAQSIKDGNRKLALNASSKLAFHLATTAPSLQDLAKRMHTNLMTLAKSPPDDGQLTNFGINAYRVFRTITWRCLSESDYPAKTYLLEPAKQMAAQNVSESDAGPIMIRLIKRLFKDESSPDLSINRNVLSDSIIALIS